MQLICATTIAFLCKVLKHFGVAHRCFGDICLQELTELIVNDIDAGITLCTQTTNCIFVQLSNIKTQERIEDATSCQSGINTLKLFICSCIKINELVEENGNRLADSGLQLIKGSGKLFFPSVYDVNCRFVVGLRHNVKHIIFGQGSLQSQQKRLR